MQFRFPQQSSTYIANIHVSKARFTLNELKVVTTKIKRERHVSLSEQPRLDFQAVWNILFFRTGEDAAQELHTMFCPTSILDAFFREMLRPFKHVW